MNTNNVKSKPSPLLEITNTTEKSQYELFLEKVNLDSDNSQPSHYSRLASILDEAADPVPAAFEADMKKLKAKLNGQEIELKEAYNTIADLKRFLDQERRVSEEKIKEAHSKSEQKILKEKKSAEEVNERQIKFIEELVRDKKSLTESLEATKLTLKEEEAKWAKKLKEQQATHTIEMKKAKEAWMAAEKIRREKWEKDKTYEIKVNTTKALQPELVSLMQKHQAQLKALEDDIAAKRRIEKEALLEECETKVKNLREKCRKEAEASVDQERSLGEQKLREQYEKLYKEFNETKAKLKTEYEQECERLEQLRKNEKNRYESEINDMRKFFDIQSDKLKKYMEEKCENEKKKVLNQENEKWREVEMKEKIEQVRAEVIEEMNAKRQQEIDMVINKLADETQEYKRTLLAQNELNIKKAIEEKDAEVKRLKGIIQDWETKYNELKNEKEVVEKNIKVIAGKFESSSQMEAELQQLKETVKFMEEEHKLDIEEVEEKYRQIVVELEQEIKEQNMNLQLIREEREKQLNEEKVKTNQDMEKIEIHVKKALAKRDETIDILRAEISNLKVQVSKYKELLEKQRRELLPCKR